MNNLNILLLGETGVGKSTWINGFTNYMTCSSLEDAREKKRLLIPMQFELIIDCEVHPISTGTDDNESAVVVDSVTQSPKSYLFQTDDVVVRLIDTPGVGDTRGYDQDKKNFENTLRCIAQLDELHGIAILLKTDHSRINITF